MKELRKSRSHLNEIHREKILINATEKDIVAETVEEALVTRTKAK